MKRPWYVCEERYCEGGFGMQLYFAVKATGLSALTKRLMIIYKYVSESQRKYLKKNNGAGHGTQHRHSPSSQLAATVRSFLGKSVNIISSWQCKCPTSMTIRNFILLMSLLHHKGPLVYEVGKRLEVSVCGWLGSAWSAQCEETGKYNQRYT